MSWRTVATVFIVIFAAALIWMIAASPLITLGEDLKETNMDDGSNQLDASNDIDGIVDSYFSTFLILIFGIMAWGAWRVFRREVTRRGGKL